MIDEDGHCVKGRFSSWAVCWLVLFGSGLGVSTAGCRDTWPELGVQTVGAQVPACSSPTAPCMHSFLLLAAPGTGLSCAARHESRLEEWTSGCVCLGPADLGFHTIKTLEVSPSWLKWDVCLLDSRILAHNKYLLSNIVHVFQLLFIGPWSLQNSSKSFLLGTSETHPVGIITFMLPMRHETPKVNKGPVEGLTDRHTGTSVCVFWPVMLTAYCFNPLSSEWILHQEFSDT